MIYPTPKEFDALTRLDFNVFVERVFYELKGSAEYIDNFHIALLCDEIEAVRLGKNRYLAIALPPRSLKSILVSVALPAWLLGHDPSMEIVCVSYGQTLADGPARDCRQVMQSSWYKKLFPGTRLAADRLAIAAFETTRGGIRRATSIGGVLTGFGADIIIVDDPTKPEQAVSDAERTTANEWSSHTLFTRLNNKAKGALIIAMQRLHEDDMIGHVGATTPLKLVSLSAIAQADEVHAFETPFGSRTHRRLEGKALHPAREPLSLLEEVRARMGTAMFTTQYLQMPTPPGGNIIKVDWFPTFDLADRPKFDSVTQSWDTANRDNTRADYSVCTTWGKKGKVLYLINVYRKRLEFPDLKRGIVTQAAIFEANTVLIEDAASGIALAQDLKADGFYKLKAVKAKDTKVMRMAAQTPMIEAGLVFIPSAAPWRDEYLHELMMFPNGRHDDQVDSTSQALGYLAVDGASAEAWIRWLDARTERFREDLRHYPSERDEFF